jgi:hypothetical protein
VTREERIARFIAPILADVDAFASEGSGSRHARYVPLVYRLGGIVRDGAIGFEEAVDRMYASVRSNGLADGGGMGSNPRRRIAADIEAGMRTDAGLPDELRAGATDGRAHTRDRAAAPRSVSLPREPHEYRRLPHAEVTEVWSLARPVEGHVTALQNLGGKPRPGIDWRRVGAQDLARVLVRGAADHVAWARPFGGRLLIPTYDAQGDVASFKARAIRAEQQPKELSPASQFTENAGAVFACPRARWMLRAGEGSADYVRSNGLVIVEGAPRWLAWATRFELDADDAPPVIGIFSGAWRPAFARRVPKGTRVLVVTDADDAGDRYFEAVRASLATHAHVVRREARKDGAHGNAG